MVRRDSVFENSILTEPSTIFSINGQSYTKHAEHGFEWRDGARFFRLLTVGTRHGRLVLRHSGIKKMPEKILRYVIVA